MVKHGRPEFGKLYRKTISIWWSFFCVDIMLIGLHSFKVLRMLTVIQKLFKCRVTMITKEGQRSLREAIRMHRALSGSLWTL